MVAMELQEILKKLCCKTGWCYAIFWKLKRRSRMVLTWEDGYCDSAASTPTDSVGGNPLEQLLSGYDIAACEGRMRRVMEKMSNHVHCLGEGLIGQVALTGKHKWVFANEEPYNQIVSDKYPTGWENQFNAGIKTIAVLAVEQGVVQLGSACKITEDANLVRQVQASFATLHSITRTPPDCPPKQEFEWTNQGISQAVPQSVLMPVGPTRMDAGHFTAMNVQPNGGVLNKHTFMDENCVSSAGLDKIGLLEAWPLPCPQFSEIRDPCVPFYGQSLSQQFHEVSSENLNSSSAVAPSPLGSAFPSLISLSPPRKCSVNRKLDSTCAPGPELNISNLLEEKLFSDFELQESLQTLPKASRDPTITSSIDSHLNFQHTEQLQGRIVMPRTYQDMVSKELENNGAGLLQVSPINPDLWASRTCHSVSAADAVVPSQIKHSQPSSRKADGCSASLAASTGLSSTKGDTFSRCSFPCLTSGCQSPSNPRQDWDAPWPVPDDIYLTRQTHEIFPPDFDSALLSDCLESGELEKWEENTQLSCPDTVGEDLRPNKIDCKELCTSLKTLSGSHTFVSQQPCQNMEVPGPQVSGVDELSEILVPLQKRFQGAISQGVGALSRLAEDFRHANSNELFTGSSWQNRSLNSFETMPGVDIDQSQFRTEPLLEAVVAGVSNFARPCSNEGDGSTLQPVLPPQPKLSVISCTSDITLNTVAKQSESKLIQSAYKEVEHCKTFEMKNHHLPAQISKESLGELEWIGGNSGESNSNLAQKNCSEDLDTLKSERSSPRQIESTKSSKKRSRPGETARPRPKDRQLIQDRLRELREIIPNSAKCSIDALLERTIKHMHFLQSVTQHREKWEHMSELNGRDVESNGLPRDELGNGASWAVELGGSEMGCPVVVENLSQPRHMLIEILCEQRELFLEISENFRAMGLTILKGMVELRNEKTWAHFIVEASRDMHRVEVLWSIMQLLQSGTENTSTVTTQGSLCCSVGTGNDSYPAFQQSALPSVHKNQII